MRRKDGQINQEREMSVLDNIGKSRVNVQEMIEIDEDKIIFDLNVRSVDL